MNDLAIGILSALLVAGSPFASRWQHALVKEAAVEEQYHKLTAEDDEALADVQRWMAENEKFRKQGAGLTSDELSAKIVIRLTKIKDAYEAFLQLHPEHIEGRIAFGSFLNEAGEEDLAAEQWEKARLMDPKNPAPWNNLANYHGHHGPVTNSFVYYEKAIELNPDEPVYYQNFATTVYLFRPDVRAHYGIEEQQVFDKALGLYRKALELSPDSFPIASDLAQTYYGIKPDRPADAMVAWRDAFKLAKSEDEKQGVYIHLARLNIRSGDYASATNELERVVLPQYAALKERLYRLIGQQQAEKKDGGVKPATGSNDLPK